MISSRRRSIFALLPAALLITMLSAASGRGRGGAGAEQTAGDPWNKSEVMMPAELVKLLSKSAGERPLVICVGFDFLFKGAHIPGAQYIGEGRDAKGIGALNEWARHTARDREVVIYCGCCPMKQCPNVRPAFDALRRMGFTQLKVLDLESNFATDWVDNGLPTEKGEGRAPDSTH